MSQERVHYDAGDDRLDEMKALRMDVSNLKGIILAALPTDEVPIAAIIVALAELQKEMALKFFEEAE